MDIGQLIPGQLAVLSNGNSSQTQGAIPNPFQSHHFVADTSEQAANFAVLAFGHGHFDPGALPLLLDRFDRVNTELAFGEVQPLAERIEDFAVRMASNQGPIEAINAVLGMSKLLSEVTIVGHDDQARCRRIQAAYAEQSRAHLRKQVDDARPTIWIAIGAYNAAGLVEQEVLLPLHFQGRTIQSDLVGQWADARSQYGFFFSVDGDAPIGNQGFTLTPGTKTTRRQITLQPDAASFVNRRKVARHRRSWLGLVFIVAARKFGKEFRCSGRHGIHDSFFCGDSITSRFLNGLFVRCFCNRF